MMQTPPGHGASQDWTAVCCSESPRNSLSPRFLLAVAKVCFLPLRRKVQACFLSLVPETKAVCVLKLSPAFTGERLWDWQTRESEHLKTCKTIKSQVQKCNFFIALPWLCKLFGRGIPIVIPKSGRNIWFLKACFSSPSPNELWVG